LLAWELRTDSCEICLAQLEFFATMLASSVGESGGAGGSARAPGDLGRFGEDVVLSDGVLRIDLGVAEEFLLGLGTERDFDRSSPPSAGAGEPGSFSG